MFWYDGGCSVIGSIIIAVGFYSVMWGQMKERHMAMALNNEPCSSQSSTLKGPLLQRDASEEIWWYFCTLSI